MAHPILAATVLFSGLILHFETNPSTHQKTAYLVDAPNHKAPRIVVSGFVSASGMAHTTTSGGERFDLPDGKQYLIFTTDMTGGVKVLPEFDNRVPHLKMILSSTTADVHADVKAGKNHNSHATVSYVKGTLGTQRCFEDAAAFSPHIMTARCLAEKVKLDIATNDNWEIREVGNPSNKIVIAANGTATVENPAPPTAIGAHQKHYALLLDSSVTIDDIVLMGKCDQNNCTVTSAKEPVAPPAGSRKGRGRGHPAGNPPRFDPRVECSNSQWP